MPDPALSVKEIQDLFTRKNFERLVNWFARNDQLRDFNHITHSQDGSGAHIKIPHGLGYVPKDIIMTRIVGAGTITFNYSLFDKTNLDVSFSDTVKFRAFVGTYWGDRASSTPSSSETQQVKASV